MGHDSMMVFLHALVSRSLDVVQLGVLAMFVSHSLLQLSAAFAFEFGYRPLVVAKAVLLSFHCLGVRIERVAVLVNNLLQLR